MAKLTTEVAEEVWNLLVRDYGANPHNQDSFVGYLTKEESGFPHEYRFGGIFGMGGKLRLNSHRGLSADYYHESRTHHLDRKMEELNAKLHEIWNRTRNTPPSSAPA